ncbi:MAG: thioredoxin domain-containing protein [Candidatus Methylumidiphilus sp.]
MNDSHATKHTNRLIDETSPYLLQHAHNPVDWFPWGDEALAQAKMQNKPIFLSIGYSACHWCHRFREESFEDETTAALMNKYYICIKVDREERPDLDKIYQLAHQLLSRRTGGWPLTVFLNPHDLVPFFAGTYFPKEPRYQLPGFMSLLEKVSAYYHGNRDKLEEGKAAFMNALQAADRSEGEPQAADAGLLRRAREQMARTFDPTHGGFGGAPKFPHTSNLEFLLRYQARQGDAEALRIAVFSLRKMAEGGIYDQLGGGFCRYSVDAEWNIPHFEKMLYDNGPLLALCSEAWQITGEPLFRRVAVQTAEWVMREMQSPAGGYYSSLDADSEGEEGRFYVWNRAEPHALLTAEEHALLALHYGLGETPNFEGHWHVYIALPLADAAARLSIDTGQAERLLASACAKLFAARETRIRPARDEKILSAWNGLMIKGMAVAGRILGREDFIDSAARALAFVRAELYRDGGLLAAWKNGRGRFPAYLDDHAFLLDAALELLQSRWERSALDFAVALADDLLNRFEDASDGGFYFTAHDHEALIHRPKPMADESMPAGNGVAALALNRLGHALGETRYTQAAERVLQAAMAGMREYPHAYGALLNAMDEWAVPAETIVLRGAAAELAAWQDAAGQRYAPGRLCLAVPAEETGLPGLLAERRPLGKNVAYVCAAATCLPPIDDLEEFRRVLLETRLS